MAVTVVTSDRQAVRLKNNFPTLNTISRNTLCVKTIGIKMLTPLHICKEDKLVNAVEEYEINKAF